MLPELKLRSFPIVYFVKTSFLEERVHILLFKKFFANYQNIAKIFSKNQTLFVVWKHQMQHSAIENAVFLNNFFDAETLAHYAPENKSNKTY